MKASRADIPRQNELQPGDFYELREAGVVGFAFSFVSQTDSGIAGVDLSGPAPFSIRDLDSETRCHRPAKCSDVKLVTDVRNQSVCTRISLGTVLEVESGRHFLTVALPKSATLPLGMDVTALVFVNRPDFRGGWLV
jgi:hypothetical protein